MRFLPVLAAVVALSVVGPAEPPPRLKPQAHSGVPEMQARHDPAELLAQSPADVPALEAALPEQTPEASPQHAAPLTEAQHGDPSATPGPSTEPPGAPLSQAAEVSQGPAASLQLRGPQLDLPMAAQGKSDRSPSAVPGRATLQPGEKPPRVSEYHWFAAEPSDGAVAIGYGHPKRQRGGEFLIGFNCKPGSGKVTFVMFEAGSSRSQFTKGQNVAVTLEIGSVRAPLQGLISSDEGTSFPRASATLSIDHPLFKVMDDDVKVLRIDIDGWSAAAPLFLINDVMPVFSKACADEKTTPEASVQTGHAVAADSAMPAQGQADRSASPPAAGTLQPKAVPGTPTPPPSEKPPRVSEYHWFEAEPRDGLVAIGYGHPRRQRGSEFLIGFNCKAGSGKVTFVMFEAGSSRSQFSNGQKVAVTLEIGSTKAPLQGGISSNEGTSFPRASATLSVDDALFKVMDDVKVLRIDIDGWSAAAPLFLINDVMPAFSKACRKKKKTPEASAQVRNGAGAKGAPVEPKGQ
jgi:hypothetical protein